MLVDKRAGRINWLVQNSKINFFTIACQNLKFLDSLET